MMNLIISSIIGFGFYLPEPFQSIIVVAAFSRVYSIGLIWNDSFLGPYQRKKYFELSCAVLTTIVGVVSGYYSAAYTMYLIVHQII